MLPRQGQATMATKTAVRWVRGEGEGQLCLQLELQRQGMQAAPACGAANLIAGSVCMHANRCRHWPLRFAVLSCAVLCCAVAQALGIKKVALLFLTTRRVAFERMWRLWLWDVAGMVPQQALPGALEAAACSGGAARESDGWRRMQTACAPALEQPSGVTGPPLPPQFLYSLYAHTPPGSEGGRKINCWAGVAGWLAAVARAVSVLWLRLAPGFRPLRLLLPACQHTLAAIVTGQ